jgi:hypothetical protein
LSALEKPAAGVSEAGVASARIAGTARCGV